MCSHRGTQFRIWATQRIRDYVVKGFAIDDKRLKQAIIMGALMASFNVDDFSINRYQSPDL